MTVRKRSASDFGGHCTTTRNALSDCTRAVHRGASLKYKFGALIMPKRTETVSVSKKARVYPCHQCKHPFPNRTARCRHVHAATALGGFVPENCAKELRAKAEKKQRTSSRAAFDTERIIAAINGLAQNQDRLLQMIDNRQDRLLQMIENRLQLSDDKAQANADRVFDAIMWTINATLSANICCWPSTLREHATLV